MSDSLKPHDYVKMGLMDELSMKDHQLDQRVVDEALGLESDPLPNQGTPQGDLGDAKQPTVRHFSPEFAGDGSPISNGQHS